MKPLTVLIVRMARGHWERCEVGTWLADTYCRVGTGKVTAVGNLLHTILDAEPTSAARNQAVLMARQARADVVVMVDNDMSPAGDFFAHAMTFLAERPGSVAIGSPYCSGAPQRMVLVTRLGDGVRFSRDEAAAKKGDELVSRIGTGLVAFRMECFETVEPPWFDYEYTDHYRAAASSTEDSHFTLRLTEAGGRVYCAWDHWSGHNKNEPVGKPTLELEPAESEKE